jgi:hypothetical protein
MSPPATPFSASGVALIFVNVPGALSIDRADHGLNMRMLLCGKQDFDGGIGECLPQSRILRGSNGGVEIGA